jgi:lysophospholipase L1-like esterase
MAAEMATKTKTKTLAFGSIYFVILAAVTLVGIEVIASFFSPSWPAYALRSTPPVNSFPPGADLPAWMVAPFNSWGMRDRERTFGPAPAGTVRTAFIGDSFVEFQPLRQSLPEAVEERLLRRSKKAVEAVNFGISGTNPQSYYYRLRDVALPLSPDAVSVFFFSGNDFLFGNNFWWEWLPPLLDESPGRSVVGRMMPHANWLLVNRLRLSEVLNSNEPIEGEFAALQLIVKEPKEQALTKLAQHMKRHYYPNVPEQKLKEILSRGDGRLLDLFTARSDDQEYLAGWLPNLILRAELNPDSFNSITTRQQADADVHKKDIDGTLSWLVAMNRLARERNVPFSLFIIPTGGVDPAFVDFWSPWPRYYSWYLHCDAMHERLVQALRGTDVPFVDLRPAFQGRVDTFRKSDAHWTEYGQSLAADRVAEQLAVTLKAKLD